MERKIATLLTDEVKDFISNTFKLSTYNNHISAYFFHYSNCFNLKDFKKGYYAKMMKDLSFEYIPEHEFMREVMIDISIKNEIKKNRCLESKRKLIIDKKSIPKIKFEKPIHYSQTKSGMDVFDVANDWNIKEPELFSALKYILRCGKKDEAVKEVEKAIDCLQRYKEKI